MILSLLISDKSSRFDPVHLPRLLRRITPSPNQEARPTALLSVKPRFFFFHVHLQALDLPSLDLATLFRHLGVDCRRNFVGD